MMKKCKECDKLLIKRQKYYCSINCSNKNKRVWNKGLTKETDTRVLKNSINHKQRFDKGCVRISVYKKCPQCNKIFKSYRNKKHCSLKCYREHQKIIINNNTKEYTCKICKKIFISNKPRIVCSSECSYKIPLGWNKGLTKKTDKRLKEYGEKISKTKSSKIWKESIIGQKCINIMRNNGNVKTHKVSKGEIEIKKYITILNINFKHDLYIEGFNGRPDFYFPKLNKIIEFNGCYWHEHKCMYPNGYHGTDKRIYQNRKRWNEKTTFYKENNIKLLVIWGCEWKNNKEEIKQKIKEFLK